MVSLSFFLSFTLGVCCSPSTSMLSYLHHASTTQTPTTAQTNPLDKLLGLAPLHRRTRAKSQRLFGLVQADLLPLAADPHPVISPDLYIPTLREASVLPAASDLDMPISLGDRYPGLIEAGLLPSTEEPILEGMRFASNVIRR